MEHGLTLELLNARLRKLEDIEEIRDLRRKYHRFINEGFFPEVASLYTEDAVVDLDVAGQARGRDDIRTLYEGVPTSLDFVRQFIHNHIVEIDGDHATGESYMEARYVRQGVSGMLVCKFEEQYRRGAHGWAISETVVKITFAVPLSEGWSNLGNKFMPPFR